MKRIVRIIAMLFFIPFCLIMVLLLCLFLVAMMAFDERMPWGEL